MASCNVIVIGGPTASGKSEAAVQLAKKVGGWIINADSQQLYEGLPILTDQPPLPYEVPHYLYGSVAYDDRSMNVAQWAQQAYVLIDKALAEQAVPIVVGGGGFYLKTLMQGLSPIPEIPLDQRLQIFASFQEKSSEELYAQLQKEDPESAKRLAAQDRQRIQRALSIVLYTGHPLSYWHTYKPPALPYVFECRVMMPSADKTEEAVMTRFQKMTDRGVIDEVLSFKKRPSWKESGLREALGLKEIVAYTEGEISFEACKQLYAKACHRYAKAQRTWFRRWV
jgi:tRNA dimethylallyltransferase